MTQFKLIKKYHGHLYTHHSALKIRYGMFALDF